MAESQIMGMMKYSDEILSLPQFHPIYSLEKAEKYVLQHSRGQGSYIVRPSTENDPNYISLSISVLGSSVCHARVHIEGNHGTYKYYLLEDIKFPTFQALLVHYGKHSINCMQKIKNLRLLTPIEKENVNSNKKDRTVSTGNLFSGPLNRDFGRHTSRPTSEPFAAVTKKSEESLRSHSVPQQDGSKPRSECQSLVTNSSTVNLNNGVSFPKLMKHDVKGMMNCRPPVSLPKKNPPNDDDACYSTPGKPQSYSTPGMYQGHKKKEQLCHCGLRLEDSILPLGWAVHCTKESAKPQRIFFQHGQITKWDIPAYVVDKLTVKQMEFIIQLFSDNQQPMPACFLGRVLVPASASNQPSFLRSISTPSTPSGASNSNTYTPLNQQSCTSYVAESQQSQKAPNQPSVLRSISTPSEVSLSNSNTPLNQRKCTSSAVESQQPQVPPSQSFIPQNRKVQDSYTAEESPYETSESLLLFKVTRLGLSRPNSTSESNDSSNSNYISSDSVENDLVPSSFSSIPSLNISTKAESPKTASGSVISSDK